MSKKGRKHAGTLLQVGGNMDAHDQARIFERVEAELRAGGVSAALSAA